jgi:hypothetical protein
MRLIDVRTRQLSEFFDVNIPPYSILSHCWGTEEVTYQEISASVSSSSDSAKPAYLEKVGYQKIDSACLQSTKDHLEWLWVDTCCIDKSSSAELSESINSMYKWYQNAMICYALLEETDTLVGKYNDKGEEPFKDKWFTRGWTLQELIAPAKVQFYDKEWCFLGDKFSHSRQISVLTTIPGTVIRNSDQMKLFGVATKMSWAAGRRTTRIEDIAYSLLGIFQVNMPLLYGEGKRAFIRLQEEILKDSDDHSILAWDFQDDDEKERHHFCGVLADSPLRFAKSADIFPRSNVNHGPKDLASPFSMTNKGLQIVLPRFFCESIGSMVAVLECNIPWKGASGEIVIVLQGPPTPPIRVRTFFRGTTRSVTLGKKAKRPTSLFIPKAMETAQIYLLKKYQLASSLNSSTGPLQHEKCLVRSDSMIRAGYNIVDTKPPEGWDKDYQIKQFYHTFGELGGRTVAAFNFSNKAGDQYAVFLCYQGFTRDCYVKIDECSRLVTDTHTFINLFRGENAMCSHSSIKMSPMRSAPAGYQNPTYIITKDEHYMTARAIKGEVLGETYIIIDVGISAKGRLKFDEDGNVDKEESADLKSL